MTVWTEAGESPYNSYRPERTERPRCPVGRFIPVDSASRKVRAPQDAVVGNTHHPQGSGKCHRKYTASLDPALDSLSTGFWRGKGEMVR